MIAIPSEPFELNLLFEATKISHLVAQEEVGNFEEIEQAEIVSLCEKHGVKSSFIWDSTMLDVKKQFGAAQAGGSQSGSPNGTV